jgi:hypothetical protein
MWGRPISGGENAVPIGWACRSDGEGINRPMDRIWCGTIFESDNSKQRKIDVRIIVMGRREKHTGFWRGNLKKIDCFQDIGVGVRIISKHVLKKQDVRACTGIDLAQDRDKWRGPVNTVMKSRIP